MSSKAKVVVAMSGGVDSCVAACLLKEQGYDVVGVTMKLWEDNSESGSINFKGCCTLEDVEDARRVCQIIGIPHYVMNFQREFRENVIDYFIDEYKKGRTPHPCLACNDKIKFDFLLNRAKYLGVDYVATGHYARLNSDGGSPILRMGVDDTKDQSYVLFNLKPDQAQSLILPIGGYTKQEIRQIARDYGLPVADKIDSQEICFIPMNDYRSFIAERTEAIPGDIIDKAGNLIGKHDGIENFTIGQRRGLGINSHEPLFVTSILRNTHQIVVGSSKDLLQTVLWASNVNYISGLVPETEINISAKIRYKSSLSPAVLIPHGTWAEIKFSEPQRAITPGQAVVFYLGDTVLGGGYIEATESVPEFAGTL